MSYNPPPSQADPYYYARQTAAQNHADLVNRISQPVNTQGYAVSQQGSSNEHKEVFLDALSDLLWGLWFAGPIFLSGKAGYNWYALTSDTGASLERTAQALVRWKWFQAGFVWTLITLAIGWSVLPLSLDIIPIWSVFFWLIIYVRFAEFSLFRRGPLQWAMTPAVRALDGVHTWAIVVAILMPLPACLMLALVPSAPV